MPIGIRSVSVSPSLHSLAISQLWEQVLRNASYWLSLICVVVAVYVKDLYLFLLKIEFNPSEVQILLEVLSLSPLPSLTPYFLFPPVSSVVFRQSDSKSCSVTPKSAQAKNGNERVPQQDGEGSALELVAY
jgi:hypothetical protein